MNFAGPRERESNTVHVEMRGLKMLQAKVRVRVTPLSGYARERGTDESHRMRGSSERFEVRTSEMTLACLARSFLLSSVSWGT